MEGAVNTVLEGQMGSFKAAWQFNVSQTTIERHMVKKHANPGYAVVKKLGPITELLKSFVNLLFSLLKGTTSNIRLMLQPSLLEEIG